MTIQALIVILCGGLTFCCGMIIHVIVREMPQRRIAGTLLMIAGLANIFLGFALMGVLPPMTRTDEALDFLFRESYNPHRMVWVKVVDPTAYMEGHIGLRQVISRLMGIMQCALNDWVELDHKDDLWVRMTHKGYLECLERRRNRDVVKDSPL